MELLQAILIRLLTQALSLKQFQCVTAMNEIISANNKMLEQQKADKEAIAEKQIVNNEAIQHSYCEPTNLG